VRDLTALFEPATVAIVGASDDPVKWGNWLARGALRGAARRRVFLVNRRGGEILGQPAYPSLAELPEPPALAVLAVPPAVLDVTVAEAIDAGARALVVITAGAEDGDAGGAGDRALAERARAAGVPMLGPNCLGVFDAAAELDLVSNDLPRGTIGLISQSGNLALEIGVLAAEAGLGFSRFASVGNQADIEAAELIAELARHEQTEVIAVYVEDFRDGRAFASAAAAAAAAGKPVVLLAIENTAATARAVASHTGALASDGAVIDAACRAGGVVRVHAPQELVDAADALLRARSLAGRRVAVLADGGGHGGIAAALLQRAGLELPLLSDDLRTELRAGLPGSAALANPVDLAGGGEQDIRSFDRCTRALLGSGEVDALLISGYFGGYALYSESMGGAELEVVGALADATRASGRPLVVQTMYPQTAACAALRAAGIPVFGAVERAAAALAVLAERRPPSGVPELPEAAAPLADSGYERARELLAGAGIEFAAARTVRDAGEARAAAALIGFPVVLKALGTLHKSDAGGVALGLADDGALAAALAGMRARLDPPAFTVERMAPLADGVELLIGARWDARFGPVALAGQGGIYAEVLRDTALALAPLDEAGARELLLSLRAAPLLAGARGRPALDVGAAAAALAALSRVAAAHPEIAAIEVNPLLVLPAGALGLDARAELA
jgi:acyl-CoA synthetase (NDP forming)